MSPNSILTAAKKKVRDSTSNLDWNLFYQITLDRIFGNRNWKFASQDMNYLHSQSVAEKTFSATSQELALNHIRHMRGTTSYTVIGGIPIPANGTAMPIDVVSPQEFLERYPDNTSDGIPVIAAIMVNNDGTNGMQISLAPRPNAQMAVWVYGDFAPSYVIDSNPLPILPLQFHWIVIDGVAALAAEENGKDSLSQKLSRRAWGLVDGFGRVLEKGGIQYMEEWDKKNSAQKPRLHQNTNRLSQWGPQLPQNFDRTGRY